MIRTGYGRFGMDFWEMTAIEFRDSVSAQQELLEVRLASSTALFVSTFLPLSRGEALPKRLATYYETYLGGGGEEGQAAKKDPNAELRALWEDYEEVTNG